MQQLAREFQDLRRTTETMAKIIVMFRERDSLAPQYVADEEKKKMRYHDIFRDDIREFVRIMGCRTLEDMIDRAWERDIKLELWTKCNPTQVQRVEDPAKRSNTFDSRSRCQQGRDRCVKFGRADEGSYGSFFNYSQTEHYNRDFIWGALICFHYNQTGHKKADCQQLSGGVARAPTPTTLRITDGREGKTEALMVKIRAFQLTVEEARAAPYVVTGMYPFYIIHVSVIYGYIVYAYD